MCRKAKVSYEKGLKLLKDAGQNLYQVEEQKFLTMKLEIKSVDKCNSKTWLEIHETAHKIGMPQMQQFYMATLKNQFISLII